MSNEISQNKIAVALQKTFCSPLILVAAILFSLTAIISMVLEGGLPVVEILSAVAMWFAFFGGRKGEKALKMSLKIFAVVAKADTIILFVLGVIFTVCGVLVTVFRETAFEGLIIDSEGVIEFQAGKLARQLNLEYATFLMLLGLVILSIGVISLLVAALVFHKEHTAAETVYQSFLRGENNILHLNFTKNAILVFAIMEFCFAVCFAFVEFNIIEIIIKGCISSAETLVFILLIRLIRELKD